jgi:predicted alpha/beta-fold hydrolase
MNYVEDFRRVLEVIHQNNRSSPLYAVGHSFGSNTLTKYLGNCGSTNRDCLLKAAVSIANPFDFQLGIKYLEDGLSDSYIRSHRQRILKL